MADTHFIGGLDLGQVSDPTALAVAEVTRGPDPSLPCRQVNHYAVRHLERYPLGTLYAAPHPMPSIASALKTLYGRPLLRGSSLAVDQTGVGRAVVDLFRALTLPCVLRAITITSGQETEADGFDFRVPKRELVGTLQRVMQTGRLRVAKRLPLAGVLEQELANFRVKITAAANETFEAWRDGQHDDLVLAVALAVWLGERVPPLTPGSVTSGGRPAAAPAGTFGTGSTDARRPPKF